MTSWLNGPAIRTWPSASTLSGYTRFCENASGNDMGVTATQMGGRLRPDGVSPTISGAPAGCCCGSEIHAAANRGGSSM